MEEWKRRVWGTLGAGLVFLALAPMATWFIATELGGSSSRMNPFVIVAVIVAFVGLYMVAAAIGDWPLPGRAKARHELAQAQRVETLKKERLVRLHNQMTRLVDGAKLVEANYLASNGEPPDESLLVDWSIDARACISNIDLKLLRSFDQQRPLGCCAIDGCSPQVAHIVGLLNARASFLAHLLDDRAF